MSPRNVILIVLATVVIFATGLVTGGLLVKSFVKPAQQRQPQFLMGRLDMLRRGVEQLDLSPDQRARIGRIIRDNQERVADLVTILEPDLQGVFREMQENVRRELTPEQRRQLEEWTRRRLRRWADSNPRPDGFPPPPGLRPDGWRGPMPAGESNMQRRPGDNRFAPDDRPRRPDAAPPPSTAPDQR